MTKPLKKAFEAASKLPDREREELAAAIAGLRPNIRPSTSWWSTSTAREGTRARDPVIAVTPPDGHRVSAVVAGRPRCVQHDGLDRWLACAGRGRSRWALAALPRPR